MRGINIIKKIQALSILPVFLILLISGCNFEALTGGEGSSLIEEETGKLYQGADLEKTVFTEDERDELWGSSKYLINRSKSKINKLKLKKNVRFLMDLKKVSAISEMRVEPKKIFVRFSSKKARADLLKKIVIRSHKYGAGFTNRFFSKGAILVGVSKKQRVPFARRITRVEKDSLDVIVHTELLRDKMEVFDKISYSLRIPINPKNMIDDRKIKERVKRITGKELTDNEVFMDSDGNYTTIYAEMIKALERGDTIDKTQNVANSKAKTMLGRASDDLNLDDYRDPSGSSYCGSGSLVTTSLDLQFYPANNGRGTTKIGTGGCLSLGLSAVVDMNDNDYFKAYVEGKEKLWLDLIFAAETDDHISEVIAGLVHGKIPLFGSFFFGVSMTFGVDLGTEVDVEGGLSVVGGFNQKWSIKRGFKVKDGVVTSIGDKDDHFDIHPLKIAGAVNIYGEISLLPYFGISIGVFGMSAAEGGINLKPYVYGEVDFQGEVNAGNSALGAFTFQTCYDMGYGVDWNYYIEGLFGTITHNSKDFQIIGRKSFLRGGTKECFPADANGVPTSLNEAQIAQVSEEFNNCIDWSEDWENNRAPLNYLLCRYKGDIHYSSMRYLGPVYDTEPFKWNVGGEYYEKYDAWQIGGDGLTAQEEEDLANMWIDIYTVGPDYKDLPEDSQGALYGAETEADLYVKHAPAEVGGIIQNIIDQQCIEKDNKYVWSNYKAELCTHYWDWYEDGYYGPDILLVTSVVQDVLGLEVYDPETDILLVDENATTESYEETRLVYEYDPNDPFHMSLNRKRWSPKYCFDWYKVAQKSTVPEDMEFFLSKCKYALLDEPRENPDKSVGENRRSLYEKVSEAYCEHLECPYDGIGAELCPNGLLKNDGTEQSTRRKEDKIWDPVNEVWELKTRSMCLPKKGSVTPIESDDEECGTEAADIAHCKDDCSTVPFCISGNDPYCKKIYWIKLRKRCPLPPRIKDIAITELLGENLANPDPEAVLNFPELLQPSRMENTNRLLQAYFDSIGGVKLISFEVISPGVRQNSYITSPDLQQVTGSTQAAIAK